MAPSREHASVVESSHKKSKMKRKRDRSLSKSETAADNERPKKQIKKDFTEIEFKVMIKDPNTTFAGTRVHNSMFAISSITQIDNVWQWWLNIILFRNMLGGLLLSDLIMKTTTYSR